MQKHMNTEPISSAERNYNMSGLCDGFCWNVEQKWPEKCEGNNDPGGSAFLCGYGKWNDGIKVNCCVGGRLIELTAN